MADSKAIEERVVAVTIEVTMTRARTRLWLLVPCLPASHRSSNSSNSNRAVEAVAPPSRTPVENPMANQLANPRVISKGSLAAAAAVVTLAAVTAASRSLSSAPKRSTSTARRTRRCGRSAREVAFTAMAWDCDGDLMEVDVVVDGSCYVPVL